MKIGIVGLDQGALAIGAELAAQGNEVACADLDPLRVRLLQLGQLPLYEPGLARLMERGLKRGTLRATNDLHEAIQGATCVFHGLEAKWMKPRDEKLEDIFCRWAKEDSPPPPAPMKHEPRPRWRPLAKLLASGKRQAARVARLSRRAAQIWRHQGFRQVLARGTRKIGRRLTAVGIITGLPNPVTSGTRQPAVCSVPGVENFVYNYAAWMAKHDPSEAELAKQFPQARRLRYQPTISLVTPVFNPPPDVLEETIRSVMAQTYPHWELCLADGQSSDQRIQEILTDYARQDPRIKVKLLPQNLGIVANSNEALALATGDFIGLLDHDDLLAPFALFEVAKFLNERPDADMVYSDEDKIDETGRRYEPFFKPQWSPDLLNSFMYTGHFTVYRRELLMRLGGIPSGCDFSQDYDLALRITEATKAIGHIPKVLYHWRSIPGSAAAGDKPYARASNLRALANSVERRGFEGVVREYPFANRVQYKLRQHSLVSIIIPSDSEEHIRNCVQALSTKTTYPHYEILVATNTKLIHKLQDWSTGRANLEFVPYDRPFNYSAKCNQAAERARGHWLLFLNDDVEPLEEGWLEAMAELFQRPDVGAVSPKLLYGDGTIQHAGLVTGVRGFVGTAFHCEPKNSCCHFNFAQSTRNTAALSAACLLIPRWLFQKVKGFDEVHTPIMHSDLDLCFKVREAGFLLVYTPFATMKHIGHASLGGADDPVGKADPAELYLLQRWGGCVANDPYYPENLRDYLYRDSATPYRMAAQNNSGLDKKRGNLLFFTHDLSFSGAPLNLFWLAKWLWDAGFFIVVYSPEAGPLLKNYQECGIPVIVDPLIRASAQSLKGFLGNFDLFVLNTVHGAGLVHLARQLNKHAIWFVHEGQYGQDMAHADPDMRSALAMADTVIFPSHATAARYRRFGSGNNHRVIRYGIPDESRQTAPLLSPSCDGKLRLLHLGSIEPRKGQDILLESLRLLPQDVARRLETHLVGRVLNTSLIPPYAMSLFTNGRLGDSLFFHGEVPPPMAKRYLQSADILVSTSRDEALPITILEAMAYRKAVVATPAGGIAEIIEPGVNGVLVPMEDARALADILTRLASDVKEARSFGAAGRATFEEQFTMARYGQDIAGLLEEFLGRRDDKISSQVVGGERVKGAA